MTVEEIRDAALSLPQADKGFLAGEILASMEPASYDVSDEEVIARAQELESGAIEDISFEELAKRLGR